MKYFIIDISSIAITILYIISLIKVNQILLRKHKLKPFQLRKIFHIALGLIVIPVLLIVHSPFIGIVNFIILFALNFKGNEKNFKKLNNKAKIIFILLNILTVLMVLSLWLKGKIIGIIFSVLAMSFGDGLAGYIGRFYGFSIMGKKTLTGSLAHFSVVFVILSYSLIILHNYNLLNLSIVLFFSIAATLLEFKIKGIYDNIALILIYLIMFSLI